MTTAETAKLAALSEDAHGLLTEGSTPSRFVETLQGHELFKDAVFFLVYGLPVTVGVRWACQCCRKLLLPPQIAKMQQSLEAAERWLEKPGEESRWAARTAAEKSGLGQPADLIAMGAFLSGGSVVPPEAPATPPPPYLAQKLIANAISLCVLTNEPKKANARFGEALQISREVVKQAR